MCKRNREREREREREGGRETETETEREREIERERARNMVSRNVHRAFLITKARDYHSFPRTPGLPARLGGPAAAHFCRPDAELAALRGLFHCFASDTQDLGHLGGGHVGEPRACAPLQRQRGSVSRCTGPVRLRSLGSAGPARAGPRPYVGPQRPSGLSFRTLVHPCRGGR